MRTLKYLLLLLLGPLCFAQPAQTIPQPNCFINFSFTTAATSVNLQNSQNCQTWTWSVYFTGSVSGNVTFQSANAATLTTPGTFGAYGGTTSTGSNPMTATGTATFTNGTVAIAWVNVSASSVAGAGVIYGVLQGWNSGASGGGGGGCSSPCPVVGTAARGAVPSGDPVQVAGWDGTDIRTLLTDVTGKLLTTATAIATSNAAVSVTSSGLTQILALSGSKVITVYHLSIGFASGVNFQLEYGTGSNCGTGTTAISGVYQAIQGIALDVAFSLPAGQALCINLGSSVTGGGLLVYTQI